MEARILNGEAPCGQERETNVCSVTGKSSEAGCGEKGGRIGQTCPQVFYEPLSATLQDFDWWSGLPVADVRNALEMIKPDLVSEKIKQPMDGLNILDLLVPCVHIECR